MKNKAKAIFTKRWWPHARAALILFHIIAITAGSIPVLVDERAMTKEAWQDPVAQDEFKKWAERLGDDWTAEDVESTAWTVAKGLLDFQSAVEAPFEPYYQFSGTRQRWRMFPAPVKNFPRLRIDIQSANSEWTTVYQMGSSEHQWLAHYFNRDRFRAALNLYAWGVHEEAYEEFTAWTARQAAKEFPKASKLRVSFESIPAIEKVDASNQIEGRTSNSPTELKHERVINLAPFQATSKVSPTSGAPVPPRAHCPLPKATLSPRVAAWPSKEITAREGTGAPLAIATGLSNSSPQGQ
ncbi:MAG: hypothetical protein AAGA58_01415 [Verrucomicrobiota bacterium]